MASLFEYQFQNQRPLQGARVGIREELSDLITNVDAKETPITSMARRGSKPGNTTFRWQVDRNPDPSVELGILDGKDVDPTNPSTNPDFKQYTLGYRTEVENNIHMFRRAVHVSNLTQDILNIAGVKDELSRQLAKATIDLKRSMEITFTSDILPAIDDGTTPYRTRCLTAWIKKDKATAATNADKYGVQNQQIRAIDENFVTPESSIIGTGTDVTTLNENTVQDLMTSVYEQTGQFKNHEAVVGTKLKRQFTELVYTTRAPASPGGANPSGVRSTRDANADTIKASVDYFEGDFGKLALIPSQFLHAGVNPYTIVETVAAGVSSFVLHDGRVDVSTRVKAQTGDGNTTGTITVSAAGVDAAKATMTAAANGALTANNLTITAATSAAADRAAAYALAKTRANLHLENAKCKGFVIPWDYLEIRYGGNIAQVRELTENGGGPRRMMEAMAALLCHSPLTFGMFDYRTNLS
jgi:hypothetical protein